jgi:hypothetical protein
LEGLQLTIDKPIELFDENLADLYTEENKPNNLVQLMAKGIANRSMKCADYVKNQKITNGVDYSKVKASKVAAKN